MDMPANTATSAVQGMAWRSRPSLSMMRVPVPWSMLPATKNRGALYSAWASSRAATATVAAGP